MADRAIPASRTRWIGGAGARLGFGLALVALVLLAAGPLGWRAGLFHYRIGLIYLTPASAIAAVAAAGIALVALFWWRSLGGRGRAMAAIGLVLGAALLYVPFRANQLRGTAGPINDITTDTANPPAFAAILAARAAEKGNASAYAPETAPRQRAAYPDIAPVTTALPPREAFKRALDAAESMSGWIIVARDAAGGRIEGYQRSTFYGFADDFVIRVAADGAGSRIDMRSASRVGRGDFGVNARRVRDYLAALKRKLG